MSQRSNPSSESDHHEYLDDGISRQSQQPVKRTRRPSYLPPKVETLSPKLESPVVQQPRPTIHQAVSSAFLSANVTNGTSTMANDDLVNTITQQVLKSLSANGVSLNPPQQQQQQDATPRSPIRDMPSTRPYTPPSPDKFELPKIDPTAGISATRRREDSDELASPHRPSARPTSPPASTRKQDGVSRPPPPERALTDDRTTLEKIWQPLFDGLGKPTERLGQFLRGLAKLIIEEYEPKHSLVITPQKMMKFYDQVKMSNELHPWNEIFSGRVKYTELSHIYRDLECEQHYVQLSRTKDKPTVPALTPLGFETWMTKMILAYPDLEFDRFAQAVLHMAISNADKPTERFPKELPRRLFPQEANFQAKEDVESSLYAGVLDGYRETPQPQKPAAPRSASIAAQPSATTGHRQSMPPPSVQPPNGGDATYVSPASSETAVDDSPPAGKPIERQRKPYHAAPGGGKVCDDPTSQQREAQQPQQQQQQQQQQQRVGRSQSVRSENVPHRPVIPPPVQRPNPPLEPFDDYGVAPRARGQSLVAPQIAPNRRRRSASRSSNTYTRSDNSIGAPPAYTTNPSVHHDDYEDNPLRKYESVDERKKVRYDDQIRPPRDLRDSRDSRDYGAPLLSRQAYDDDHRRSRVYTNDYPPPPPPNYR